MSERHRHPESGFSLVEIMIVVAVLGILAGILVPNFMQSRIAANEGAVIATLRSISTSQFEFKSMQLVDADQNGGYEYSTMREMTGGAFLRGGLGDRLSPNLLPMSLDHIDATGRFVKHGYYFQLFLPDASGAGQPETPAGVAAVDPNLCEGYWTLVAWPANSKSSGRATYFVNQQGEVVKTTGGGYSGLANVPPAGAALIGTSSPDRIDSNRLAVGSEGADGNTWVGVR